MTTKNLSSVATAVIESYGNTAINMINAYRVGGERVIGFVDQRFEAAVKTGASRLSEELRSNLIDTEKRISGLLRQGPAARQRARRDRGQQPRWTWPPRAWTALPRMPSVLTRPPSSARWA